MPGPGDAVAYARQHGLDGTDDEILSYLKEFRPDVLAPFGEVAKKARVRLANLQHETAQADYAQEVANIKGRAVGEVASALPAVALAPVTGGMSLAPALGTMAGAGALGGLLRESAKAAVGSTELPVSPRGLARGMALDAVLGAGGEGIGRGVALVAKGIVPTLIEKAGAKTQNGLTALNAEYDRASRELWLKIGLKGNPEIPIGHEMQQLVYDLKSIPKPTGKFGSSMANMSDAASTRLDALLHDLGTASGGVSPKQKLDALMRLQGAASEIGWHDRSLNQYEAEAFKRFAGRLAEKITPEAKALGVDDLYAHTKELFRSRKESRLALDVAQSAVQAMAKKVGVGTLAGGAVGYREGGVKGAVAGAVAGTVADAAVPKLAAWMLERAYSTRAGSRLVRQAAGLYEEGKTDAAMSLMARVAAITGVREHISDALRPKAESATER